MDGRTYRVDGYCTEEMCRVWKTVVKDKRFVKYGSDDTSDITCYRDTNPSCYYQFRSIFGVTKQK
jgi:hypothetical protein